MIICGNTIPSGLSPFEITILQNLNPVYNSDNDVDYYMLGSNLSDLITTDEGKIGLEWLRALQSLVSKNVISDYKISHKVSKQEEISINIVTLHCPPIE